MSDTRRSHVLLFMLIAYGGAWVFWVPGALIAQGVWVAPAGLPQFLDGPLNPAAWGPLIAAILVTWRDAGLAGVKTLLGRGLAIRLGGFWYLIILLIFPLLIGGSLWLAVATGAPAPAMPALAQPITLPIALVVIFFIGGPLQEEFGWRGYALEHLQTRFNSLVAGALAGLMWGAWHLPLFFIPRQEFYYNRPVWGLLLTTTLVGIIVAWIYNNTRHSVFAVMLAHAMFNWSHYVFPTLGVDRAALILFGLMLAVVVFIVARYGAKRLQRE